MNRGRLLFQVLFKNTNWQHKCEQHTALCWNSSVQWQSHARALQQRNLVHLGTCSQALRLISPCNEVSRRRISKRCGKDRMSWEVAKHWKQHAELAWWLTAAALKRLRQGESQVLGNVGYKMRPYLKRKIKKKNPANKHGKCTCSRASPFPEAMNYLWFISFHGTTVHSKPAFMNTKGNKGDRVPV